MLVSLSDMKAFLGISGGDTTYDAFLTMQLDVVSDAVEEYCKRKFSEATYLQSIHKDEVGKVNSFYLKHYPLISLDSFLDKDDPGDSGIAVLNYRYNKDSAKMSKISGGRFFQNGSIMEVTYTAGYAIIPNLIQEVVRSIVQERYNKKVNGIDLNFGSDVQRISIPGTLSVDYDYSLSGNDRKTPLGNILGNHVNVLDAFRSERAVLGTVTPIYVEPQ